MKKYVCLFMILAYGLFGCDSVDPDNGDDLIWDFWCHSISMKVTDASGNDLFNAETPCGPWEEGPYVVYNNKKYDLYLGNPQYKMQTRALPPSFLELYLMKDEEGQYYLCFGEFSPTSNYHRVPFTIYWGDGSKDQISFDLYITWKSKREPVVHRNVYLNGELMDNSLHIPIVK